MPHPIGRRLFCASVSALAAGAPWGAGAEDLPGLEGTWGGAQSGVSAQVIIAGGSVIGFFWRCDYLDTQAGALSADGQRLSFAFRGGKAALTRTGEGAASLDVSEGERAVHLNLWRD